MDYFMLFFKKNNLNLFLFLSLTINLSMGIANEINNFDIKGINVGRDDNSIFISLEQSSTLPPNIIELLERGIPIAFNLKIEIIKENKFWFDKVIQHYNYSYKIKYFSLRKVFEVIDIKGNTKSFKSEQEAIQSLLNKKEIIIKKYKNLEKTKLKIWVELDKGRLPKAIQADVFNKSWDVQSNIILYDMREL
jgi:hypothetical protein